MYISGLVWWQIIIPWHPKHVHVGVDFSISRQNSISWGVTGVILVNREMYKTCVWVFSGAFFVFVSVPDFCIFVKSDILEYGVWEHRRLLTVNMHGYNSWQGVLHIYWVYICKATLKSITSLFIFHWHSVISDDDGKVAHLICCELLCGSWVQFWAFCIWLMPCTNALYWCT